ncbi:MAG: hypothetical protein PSN34_01240 [Urechidicola sp.]|nr:hypothetical protein [Urechidicola sp.]
MENKKQKFERLANARVNKALKQLDLISNLSNKNAYDYSENEVNQIIVVLDKKVKELKTKFLQGLSNKQFKL